MIIAIVLLYVAVLFLFYFNYKIRKDFHVYVVASTVVITAMSKNITTFGEPVTKILALHLEMIQNLQGQILQMNKLPIIMPPKEEANHIPTNTFDGPEPIGEIQIT